MLSWTPHEPSPSPEKTIPQTPLSKASGKTMSEIRNLGFESLPPTYKKRSSKFYREEYLTLPLPSPSPKRLKPSSLKNSTRLNPHTGKTPQGTRFKGLVHGAAYENALRDSHKRLLHLLNWNARLLSVIFIQRKVPMLKSR
jgi:hypothetical protein